MAGLFIVVTPVDLQTAIKLKYNKRCIQSGLLIEIDDLLCRTPYLQKKKVAIQPPFYRSAFVYDAQEESPK